MIKNLKITVEYDLEQNGQTTPIKHVTEWSGAREMLDVSVDHHRPIRRVPREDGGADLQPAGVQILTIKAVRSEDVDG